MSFFINGDPIFRLCSWSGLGGGLPAELLSVVSSIHFPGFLFGTYPTIREGKGRETEMDATLLILNECFVYKIPPRTSAMGYKAADWDLHNPLWKGRLTITAEKDVAQIRLEDSNTGKVFAMCPVPLEGARAVEPVLDSSRYFVLRIEDGKGNHAFIGMGFNERGDAFDFNVALQEHRKQIQRDREIEAAREKMKNEPALDLSLKQGEKIRVNIKNVKPKATAAKSGGGGIKLAPPPQAGVRASSSAQDEEWGDFTS